MPSASTSAAAQKAKAVRKAQNKKKGRIPQRAASISSMPPLASDPLISGSHLTGVEPGIQHDLFDDIFPFPSSSEMSLSRSFTAETDGLMLTKPALALEEDMLTYDLGSPFSSPFPFDELSV
eukprot:m.70030 g.70030  ORF g.70030 m.70030 type:complete len:122 (+) comp12248_c3_seq1:862-1227(+)